MLNTISSQQYLSFLGSFGLSLSNETGGSNPLNLADYTLHALGDAMTLTFADGDPILFLEPELFFETIRSTESSLGVKLFN